MEVLRSSTRTEMIQYSHIVQTALNKRSIDADAGEKHVYCTSNDEVILFTD
jgi:hypothetical protein